MVTSTWLFALTSFFLALAPGPDNLFVITQSAMYGWRNGVLITLGLCTGLLVHTSLVVVGLATLIQASPAAFWMLKGCGALYLVYLAWGAWRSSMTSGGECTIPDGWHLYRRGIVMNVTNPKVSIFFLAFLPQFVTPGMADERWQILLLGWIFILVSLLTFSGFALLAARLRFYLVESASAQQWLNRTASVVFAGLAMHLLVGEWTV